MPLKITTKADFDIEVSKKSMEACEHIISEMGADLHDDLIQKLSALRLHLDKIERSSYDPEQTKTSVIKMQADFQGIVEAVRRISRRLHPIRMEGDTFKTQLQMLCVNMELPGSLRIETSFEGDLPLLDHMVENYLLRMIQELTHNAFKHSAAWTVKIRVTSKPDLLKIEVEDDGSGFSRVEEFIGRLRQKYNTLRMRADAIGAKVSYKSNGKGLLATIKLPINRL